MCTCHPARGSTSLPEKSNARFLAWAPSFSFFFHLSLGGGSFDFTQDEVRRSGNESYPGGFRGVLGPFRSG